MSYKIDRWDIAEGIEDGLVYRPDTGSLVEYADHVARMGEAQATVAQQTKMIEHLRGGPTPLYTGVDMANAARDGFRDGAASLLPVLEMARPYVGLEGSDEELAQLESAIIAAGGRVKE